MNCICSSSTAFAHRNHDGRGLSPPHAGRPRPTESHGREILACIPAVKVAREAPPARLAVHARTVHSAHTKSRPAASQGGGRPDPPDPAAGPGGGGCGGGPRTGRPGRRRSLPGGERRLGGGDDANEVVKLRLERRAAHLPAGGAAASRVRILCKNVGARAPFCLAAAESARTGSS